MSLWDVGNTGTPDYQRWLDQEWVRELDEYILKKYGNPGLTYYNPPKKELDRQEPEDL